jgi:hypothetical protein
VFYTSYNKFELLFKFVVGSNNLDTQNIYDEKENPAGVGATAGALL